MDGVIFTGIRNIGGCGFSKPIAGTSRAVVKNNLIMQLSDDFMGKDLTAYEDVIKECGADFWYKSFPHDNRIVHIMTEYVTDLSKEIENPIPQLFLNYNLVPVNKRMLPLFSYIAKLTRRISNMEDWEFKRANDFVYGPIGRICLLPEFDMMAVAKQMKYKFKDFMDEVIFSNKSSTEFAKKINENIKTQMIDYLR